MTSARRLEKLLEDYRAQIASLSLKKPEIETPVPAAPPPQEGKATAALAEFLGELDLEMENLRGAPAPKPPRKAPAAEPPKAEPALVPLAEPPAPIPAEKPPAPEAPPVERHPAPSRAAPPPMPASHIPLGSVPARQAEPGGARLWLAGAAVLAFAGGLWWGAPRKAPDSAWPLDFPSPIGIVARDGRVIVGCRSRRELVTLDGATGKTIRSDRIPGTVLAGLSLAERSLWSVDAWERKVFRHRLSDYAVIGDFPSPGPKPSAILADGAYVWTIDQQLGNVYQHRVEDSALPVAFEAPLGLESPIGLQRVEERLWVLDAASRRIARFDVMGKDGAAHSLVMAGRAALPPSASSGSPVGFTVQNQDLLLLTEHPAQVLRIPFSALDFQR